MHGLTKRFTWLEPECNEKSYEKRLASNCLMPVDVHGKKNKAMQSIDGNGLEE